MQRTTKTGAQQIMQKVARVVGMVLVNLCVLQMLILPLLAPAPALAARTFGLVPIVPDSCYEKPTQTVGGRVQMKCGWEELVQMGQNIIYDAIYFAAMIAVISIVYAGYLYMSSGDDAGARGKANGILWNVVIGIFFTMAAWLLVNTVVKFLGVKDSYTLLGK